MICNSCQREMTSHAGSEFSGNTKYQRYICKCGHKQLNYHEPWIKMKDGSWVSPLNASMDRGMAATTTVDRGSFAKYVKKGVSDV